MRRLMRRRLSLQLILRQALPQTDKIYRCANNPLSSGLLSLLQFPGGYRLAVEFRDVEKLRSRVVVDIGGILFLGAGVQQEFFFTIGMHIVNIPYPFADDEVTVSGGFDAVPAIG